MRLAPIGLLLALVLASPALAQRAATSPPLPLPPPPAPPLVAAPMAAAQPPAESEDLGWRMACGEATAEAPRSCRVSTTVLLRPQNTPLAQILLTRQRESRGLALLFQLPHGTWVPGGIAWQVDESAPRRLAFQSSDAAGLYAVTPVNDDLLASLREASLLRLGFVALARRETVTLPIPLAGFGAAVTEMLATEAATASAEAATSP